MPISDYLRELRTHVGTNLLLVPAVTAIIHNEAGQVLMVYSTDEFWGTPGGAIDPGETAAAAIVREVREELGVEVEPIALLAVYHLPVTYLHGDRVEYTSLAFRCRIVSGTIAPLDGEIVQWEWVEPSAVVARGVRLPERVLVADYAGPPAF